jgi:hypothetical protein
VDQYDATVGGRKLSETMTKQASREESQRKRLEAAEREAAERERKENKKRQANSRCCVSYLFAVFTCLLTVCDVITPCFRCLSRLDPPQNCHLIPQF